MFHNYALLMPIIRLFCHVKECKLVVVRYILAQDQIKGQNYLEIFLNSHNYIYDYFPINHLFSKMPQREESFNIWAATICELYCPSARYLHD